MPSAPSASAMACPTRCPAPVTSARLPRSNSGAPSVMGSEREGDLRQPAAGRGERRFFQRGNQAIDRTFAFLAGRGHARRQDRPVRRYVDGRFVLALRALAGAELAGDLVEALAQVPGVVLGRSEEHTSELQSL